MNKNTLCSFIVVLAIGVGFLGGYIFSKQTLQQSLTQNTATMVGQTLSESDEFVEMLGSRDGADIVDSLNTIISTESENVFSTLVLLRYSGSYLWHNYQIFDTHTKKFVARDLFSTACDEGCDNNTEPILVVKDNLLLVQRTFSDYGVYGQGPSEIWFADFSGKLLKKVLDYDTTKQDVLKTQWHDIVLTTYADNDRKYKASEIRYLIDPEKLILEKGNEVIY